MDNYEALARKVKSRRTELGLSQADVASLGGPSTTSVSRIELGRLPNVSLETLGKLDHVLGWEQGSAKVILKGGSPTVVATTAGSSKLGSATLGQIVLPGDVAEGLNHDERAEVQSAAEAAARKRAREIRYERSKLDRERRVDDRTAVPSSDPVTYADEAFEKFQRAQQSDYAPAAHPDIQDPYEGLGEEPQEG